MRSSHSLAAVLIASVLIKNVATSGEGGASIAWSRLYTILDDHQIEAAAAANLVETGVDETEAASIADNAFDSFVPEYPNLVRIHEDSTFDSQGDSGTWHVAGDTRTLEYNGGVTLHGTYMVKGGVLMLS